MTRSEQTKLRLSKSVNSQDMTVINILMERQKKYLILINYNQWWQRSSDQQLPPTLTRCTRKRGKKNLKYIRIWLIIQLRHFWNWTAIVEFLPHMRMVLLWGSQAKIPPLEPWQHLYKIWIRSKSQKKIDHVHFRKPRTALYSLLQITQNEILFPHLSMVVL